MRGYVAFRSCKENLKFVNLHVTVYVFTSNRLVAFNLGYLPGGDKTVITKSETTLLGMNSASRILASGGLISVLVYVGHPGGMEEYEMVEGFASGLAVNEWICCKLQMMNRPLAPILVLLCKR
ncbi:putative rRNA methylase [Helianthus annuus]|nr:putative rRNA methylase [Helianthus annuus]